MNGPNFDSTTSYSKAEPALGSEHYLERLCELAARDQWKLDDLAWDTLDVHTLPEVFRQTAAECFVQLRRGERTAEHTAAQLLEFLPEGPERTFVMTQRIDEARHVAFFDRLIQLLGCEPPVRDSVEQLMTEVEAADSPEALVLGMQIFIESVGQSLFLAGSRAMSALEANGGVELDGGPIWSLKTVLRDWMPRLLGRDESRHIAFGLHFLRQQIPQLEPTARQKLENTVAYWGRALIEPVRDPDLINAIGGDGEAVCRQLIDDLNLRLAQVGLDTRIAPLKAAT